MIPTLTRIAAVLSLTVTLGGALGACTSKPPVDSTPDSQPPAGPSATDAVLSAWDAYTACPDGCPISSAEMLTLVAFYEAIFQTSTISDESRAVIEALRVEAESAGIHPVSLVDRVQELPSYTDPRLEQFFLQQEPCLFFDELNGDPPGTLECEVGGQRWVEPISKGITIAVASSVIVGGAACSARMLSCDSSAESAWRAAPELCPREQTMDADCSYAVYVNQHNNCKPCGGSPDITAHQACCR